MKSSSPLWTIAIAVLLVCCCLTWLLATGAFALLTAGRPLNVSAIFATATPIPVATRTLPATFTPTRTQTPAPTNTLVIQPGIPLTPLIPVIRNPTRANPYNIVVPTPTGVALKYPVTYDTKFTVTTYNVIGDSLNEISEALDANAMPDPHSPNDRFYARTDWYLSSSWWYVPTSRGCELERAQISMVVTMTLPALVTTNVPSDVQKRWDTFLGNTIAHENGHVKIVYDGARNYQRQLGNYTPSTNCDIFQNQMKEVFRKNYNQIDRANVDYDATTKHGETQGAVFP